MADRIEPARAEEAHPAGFGPVTGTLLIVANIIGVGVFMTTGYMVDALQSPPAVLLVWGLGGIAAFCGALTYAEMGATLQLNGGEYQLLSRIYHPVVGFVAGWVSLVAGFSAPLASYAIAFGDYLARIFPDVSKLGASLGLIACCAVVHALHITWGSRFHNAFTIGKILLILLFIVSGLALGDWGRLTAPAPQSFGEAVASPLFAVQLVYVSFAYAGWNAAGYLAGEFRRPGKDILRSVVFGTSIVTILYLGLNIVFLIAAPREALAGQRTVAHVAATHLFGESGGKLVSGLLVIGLVSTVSANLVAGPRVYEAMGRDYSRLRFLSVRRTAGGPIFAIALQSALGATFAAGMILFADLKDLLDYIGITLSLFAGLTVLGVMVMRYREPDLPRPYRTWGYPVTPLLFLALEGWMLFFVVRSAPIAAAYGAGTILTGLVLYAIVGPSDFGRKRPE